MAGGWQRPPRCEEVDGGQPCGGFFVSLALFCCCFFVFFFFFNQADCKCTYRECVADLQNWIHQKTNDCFFCLLVCFGRRRIQHIIFNILILRFNFSSWTLVKPPPFYLVGFLRQWFGVSQSSKHFFHWKKSLQIYYYILDCSHFSHLEQSVARPYSVCGCVVLEYWSQDHHPHSLLSPSKLLDLEMSKVATRWTQRAEPIPGLRCCHSKWEMNNAYFRKHYKVIFYLRWGESKK